MRLAKYLAQAGVSSRRRAEIIISEGRISVNGQTADQPQMMVDDSDLITFDGKPICGFEKKEYLLLNKPAGYISTAQDTHERPTVTSLVADLGVRIYPVGRLDADTNGVLLLTNDGELAYRLVHPRYQVKKVYQAWVRGIPDAVGISKMSNGLLIDGETTAPASVSMLTKKADKSMALLEITLIEGRKRQVKKMCQAIGHPVIKLSRVSFAGLRADNVKEGSYRRLTQREINALYRLVML
jgi:23S rRNA pseudouridine2605 synthase